MTTNAVAVRYLVFVCTVIAFAVPAHRTSAAPALHSFDAVAISPDGSRVVSVEGIDAPDARVSPAPKLMLRSLDGRWVRRIAACPTTRDCTVASPAWAPDGSRIAFVRRDPIRHRSVLESVDADGSHLRTIVSFAGSLATPRFSPDGKALAVLATAGARKEAGATQAGAPIVGEIGASIDEQRIAIVDSQGEVRMISPPDMFVYEYDWLPDGTGFAGTAAHGNGDNNWWVARLYAFAASGGAARELYKPPLQIASPRVSPDGRSVAFIGGLMSDFGSTGGDVYTVSVNGGDAVDLTPGLPATPTSLLWNGRSDQVTFTELAGSRNAIATVDVGSHRVAERWSDTVSIGTFDEDADVSIARDGTTSAVVSQTFERPPEIAAGALGAWHDLTHDNAGLSPAGRAQSVEWTNDGFHVQGWLLAPLSVDPAHHHAAIVQIHGGPSAAAEPHYIGPGTNRDLLARGYFLFLPNPRGSFGQGEAFVRANVKDFGGGDLRDVLAGLGPIEKTAPIDDARLGLTGGSYGGYMTMFAVTQTNRFKAGVAIAGIANWQSYYGENGIDEWMLPFFGASVYDDPAVYAKSSPITFIEKVQTPTLAMVGERDVECPMAQSLEFWHALVTQGVPTSLVIYPDEGHRVREPQHRRDMTARTVAWFDRYLR